ncbi:MAG: hypothetical protein K9W44_04200 [Candidatus Lokiarchaeota archaeon]|nr:hypothetical protein [Candidatus Harpocratesius repetitus]
MEMILGVIEDLLDKYENGTPEEKEDSLNSLKLERDQFLQNLKPLVEAGNSDAQKIYNKLENLSF